MNTAVIFSGGDIDDDFALAFLNSTEAELLIGADRGISFLRRHGIMPDHIIGDFDSAPAGELEYFRKNTGAAAHILPPEKDETDTGAAVRLTISLGCDDIYILGGTGGRIDHLLANIRTLALARRKGVSCYLLDPCNKIRVIDAPLRLTRAGSFGKYVSLFALGGSVAGLTLTGFKYPLKNYTMYGDDPLGVSNEIISETAEISFGEGRLIIAETRDQAGAFA